jgi:hypothetical protein
MKQKTVPFAQRFGIASPSPLIDRDFPDSARVGLVHILAKLVDHDYVLSWSVLSEESLLVARRLKQDFENATDQYICVTLVQEMAWDKVYVFCEKAWKVLQSKRYWDERVQDIVVVGTLVESQHHFEDEINILLAEENLAYEFVDGVFQRRGRPQTQKSLQRMSAVLSDPRYAQARTHFNKAVKFFNERPSPDVQNCIKEAACTLEAFVEILFGKKAAKSFDEIIRSKQGNAEGLIPPIIGDGIIKLRAFRGNAQGVAHAALDGGFVSEIEAELILNLVASYVTYLNDRFPSKEKEEEIPF